MPLKSLAQLVRPTRRALPWRPPLAATVLAIVIVGWAVHRRSSGAALAPALRNASLFLAVGSAMALEDETATVLAPSPISVAWRRVVRLALAVTAAAAAGWAACLGLAWWAGGSLPLGDLSLEGLAGRSGVRVRYSSKRQDGTYASNRTIRLLKRIWQPVAEKDRIHDNYVACGH